MGGIQEDLLCIPSVLRGKLNALDQSVFWTVTSMFHFTVIAYVVGIDVSQIIHMAVITLLFIHEA